MSSDVAAEPSAHSQVPLAKGSYNPIHTWSVCKAEANDLNIDYIEIWGAEVSLYVNI